MLKKLSYSLLLFIVFSGLVLQGCLAKAPTEDGSEWDVDIKGKTEMSKEEAQIIFLYKGKDNIVQKVMYNDPTTWDKVYEFKGQAGDVGIGYMFSENAALIGKDIRLNLYTKDGKDTGYYGNGVFKDGYEESVWFGISMDTIRDIGNIRLAVFFTLDGVEYYTQIPMFNVVTG